MNTTVDIYEKYKKPIDELTKINPELGNFYKLEFLKKEAKKRGLYDIGSLTIKMTDGIVANYFQTVDNRYILDKESNTLFLDGVKIFSNGKWAEVIKEKTLSKSEAEAKLTELCKDGFEYKIEF